MAGNLLDFMLLFFFVASNAINWLPSILSHGSWSLLSHAAGAGDLVRQRQSLGPCLSRAQVVVEVLLV